MPEASQKILTYEIERDGDAALVKCHGRLVAGVTQQLYEEIKPLLSERKRVIVDLAGLTYMDSMGLGVMVRLYVSARQQGCAFQLLHLGKQVRNLLKMTNLLSVFAHAEDDGIVIA